MRTVALRFSNSFAPACGTIKAHQELIDSSGYVWYGKLGSRVSDEVSNTILGVLSPMILLIHSGSFNRYWAYIDKIQYSVPPLQEIPEYYRDRADNIKTWFRIIKFEKASKDVLSHCFVASSGMVLTRASMHSMSPYFIIDYREDLQKKE